MLLMQQFVVMTKGVLWLYSEQIANRVLDNIVDQVTGTMSPIFLYQFTAKMI